MPTTKHSTETINSNAPGESSNRERKSDPDRLRGPVLTFVIQQWKSWRLFVCLILFVIIPLKSSLADWNWVPTGSMNPTIIEGDMIFINKAAYDLRIPLTMTRVARWADPQRGDIVVLFSPADGKRLVKRVIGVPGDTVEMTNNVVVLNGKTLEYSPLSSTAGRDLPSLLRSRSQFSCENLEGVPHTVMSIQGLDFGQRSFPPHQVPDGQYFLMGDNRDNSNDSRVFGFAARESIIGQGKRVLLSIDKSNWWQPRWNRFFSKLK